MNLRILISAFRALLIDKSFGDFAALKSIASNPCENASVVQRVLPLRDLIWAPIDFETLRTLPAGSFGRAYLDFMEKNRLTAINPSRKYGGYYSQYPVSVRYTRTHDMFHVLLGFDTSLIGELGVYAFVHAQNYSGTLAKAYKAGKFVARLFKPSRWKEVLRVDQWGLEQGRKASCVLAEPLENCLHESIHELRKRLGIIAFSDQSSNT